MSESTKEQMDALHYGGQAEQGWSDEVAMKHRAAQLAASMDSMAFDHEQRAKMLREGANAVRHKAGLPEHT